MEAQILRFYLKVFSFLLILIFYFLYIFFIKELAFKNEFFLIDKFSSSENVVDSNIEDNRINKFIYKQFLKIILINKINIHYGKFNISETNNFIELIKIITQPSNYYEKITIVEGWAKNDLNKILSNYFEEFVEFEYTELIADTYLFNEYSSFIDLKNIIDKRLFNLKQKFKNHKLLHKFSFNEIIIIGSLLEKEGIDDDDKRKIYSVIINRLNKKMRLQIDATVIYAITKGSTKFDRKVTYQDLKIKDSYNTYLNFGLPPKPISYVGYKTIELIFEDYKTDYLFYFYNSIENNHIFSKNYKDHLMRLNEYKSKK